MKISYNKISLIIVAIACLFLFSFSLAQTDYGIPQLPKEAQEFQDSLKDFDGEIDEDTIKKMFPTTVNLSFTPNPVSLGNPVEVSSQVIGDYDQESELSFKWFLDGKQQNSKAPTFKFNMQDGLARGDLRCGDSREVKVEVTNHKIDDKATGITKIPISLDLNFAKTVIGVANFNNPQASNYNLSTVNVPVQDITLQVPDIFRKTIPQGIFRYGDIVEVTPIDLKNTYDNKACDGGSFEDFEAYAKTLGFQWSFNGVSQETKSGKGTSFQKANFVMASPATQVISNDSGTCGTALNQSQDQVALEIFDANGALVAQKQEYLQVTASSIKLEPVCGAYGKDIQCLNVNTTNNKQADGSILSYQLNPGDETSIQANLSSFQPSEKLDIIWKQNSNIISQETIDEPNTTVYTSPIIKMGNEKTDITIEITNYPYSKATPETTTQAIIITPSEVSTAPANITGSLKRFLPNSFTNIINFVFVIGLIGIALLIINLRERQKR